MKKLPSIYKTEVGVDNNRRVFYSKDSIFERKNISNEVVNIMSKEEVISEVFKNKKYSYTKKVRLKIKGEVIETRLVIENNNEILTIDNTIIKKDDIESIEIIN